MSDKNPVIPNICAAEPVANGPVDVIWTTSDFHNETCLPEIGSCQVSSILSTLEQVPLKSTISEELQDTSPVLDNLETFKSIAINIINSDSVPTVEEVKKRKRNKQDNVCVLEKKQLFQEMVYFGCNLCPFICTKDSKITDHIKSVHNSKDNNKKTQLKCPGCSNIFYHKLSLRSHLIYDHEVGKSDINKIVNSIVYVSMLTENNNDNETASVVTEEKKNDAISFLTEDVQMEEENNDNNSEEDNVEPVLLLENVQNNVDKNIDDLDPPDLEIHEDYSPKQENNDLSMIVNDIKQPNIRRNSVDDPKRTQKCCISTCAVRMCDVVNMAYHVKCHFGKIFRCLECGTNFVVWKTLQTHLWRNHNIDMELYSCDKCDYKTYSLAKLNNIHKLIHGNDKPYLCDLCGKGFKNPKQLRNHKMIHKDKSIDKMHKCNICDRTFADKRLLKVHTAGVHQKLKPFSCSYCGYKAASNGALKLHIRQHTGEKPFSCDSCEYSTADHNSLRRHKSRHSGDKKYKCMHCDYACIQSSTYKTHLKTKHPGLENEHMFSCPYCQFRSVSSDKYMIHLSSHKEKKKPNAQKIIDMIENICEGSEGLQERVVEIVQMSAQNKKSTEVEFVNLSSLKKTLQDGFVAQDNFGSEQKLIRLPKKPDDTENRLQETPVALISKINDTNTDNHCIILPVQTENIMNLTNTTVDNSVLPTTTISSNNIQYYYSSPNVLLEIIDEKTK